MQETPWEKLIDQINRIAADPKVPCTQCGHCCIRCPCGMGTTDHTDTCIYLMKKQDGTRPYYLALTDPKAARLLGIGYGCIGGKQHQ